MSVKQGDIIKIRGDRFEGEESFKKAIGDEALLVMEVPFDKRMSQKVVGYSAKSEMSVLLDESEVEVVSDIESEFVSLVHLMTRDNRA